MWLKFGQETYPYDENFRSVSNYALKNNIKVKKHGSIINSVGG